MYPIDTTFSREINRRYYVHRKVHTFFCGTTLGCAYRLYTLRPRGSIRWKRKVVKIGTPPCSRRDKYSVKLIVYTCIHCIRAVSSSSVYNYYYYYKTRHQQIPMPFSNVYFISRYGGFPNLHYVIIVCITITVVVHARKHESPRKI